MQQLRFGKHPPKVDYRTLRLGSYLTPALDPPPPAVDQLARVMQGTGINDPATLFPIDGNDTYGDCTIAALAHAITVYNGLVGRTRIPPAALVEKVYFKLTKGVDTGLAVLDVLNYWQGRAVDGDRIAAYVAVSPKNPDHVRQAIRLFGGVYLGFQVQAAAQDDFQARRPWTPGPLTQHGHAVFAVAYDANGLTLLTWGSTQKATWDWWAECVDEAYAILAPQALLPGFAPGFDAAALQADLQAVAD